MQPKKRDEIVLSLTPVGLSFSAFLGLGKTHLAVLYAVISLNRFIRSGKETIFCFSKVTGIGDVSRLT